MAILMNAVRDKALRRGEELLSSLRLSPQLMTNIMQSRSSIRFKQGSPIFCRGSAADAAYCVLSGLVKVYLPLNDGSRILVTLAGSGDFLGLVYAIGADGHHVQSLEAEAMTMASLAVFTREQAVSLLKSMAPSALVDMLEDVNANWSGLFSWWINFLGLGLRERLLTVLENLAIRYGVRESRGVLLPLELTHRDLAEMIVSSRPMVSRLITDLIATGELTRNGRHYILVRTADITSKSMTLGSGARAQTGVPLEPAGETARRSSSSFRN